MIDSGMLRHAMACFALAVGLAGCSRSDNRPSGPTVSKAAIAKQKVDNMSRLADAAAADPAGVAVLGLVEEMRNQPLDATECPDEAAQFVSIYNERVKGKLRGEIAQEVAAMVSLLERQLKAAGKPG
jgi:hypothetical protein